MSNIVKVHARQVLDSRGNPTVEAEVTTRNNVIGRASVPSGASTGKHEAVELRDKNNKIYLGKSVLKSVNNINTLINENLIGVDVVDQLSIDQLMIDLDGTTNKKNLGANSILAVSLACAKAAALEKSEDLFTYIGGDLAQEMPIPMMNILNGGSHADNLVDFQEFMIVPTGANSFSQALQMGTEIFHYLKQRLKLKGYSTNVGDEGGFAPNLSNTAEVMNIISESIHDASYNLGKDVHIAIDVAASEFYNKEEGTYDFDGQKLKADEMISFWQEFVNENRYVISIEDALYEDDWESWSKLTSNIGDKVQLVGDDLFVTNVNRLSKGIKNGIANSILIKPNQIGTLTETIRAVRMAQKNHYTTVMSHRSGETEDTIISDLSVALNCGQIKTGSLSRSDRVAKYNQLLRIEEKLADKAQYNGKSFRFI